MRKKTETLVAVAPDGTEITLRTSAGYDWVGLIRRNGAWSIAAKGCSKDSVRRRAETAGYGAAPVVVPLKARNPALPEFPEEITAHFERSRRQAGAGRRETPVIAEVFTPGKGWATIEPVPATFAAIRAFSADGAAAISCRAYGSPLADFPVEPILHKADMPLLGGSLIGSAVRART